ncbi:MAG: 30S ribosomal protein S27ae [Candidatus Nanoarchaeia archaeon]|nr:30S ribosomal protein S27ae [Candidatus Nanoarchaeia archaeon]
MAKKKVKNKRPSEKWKKYKVSGDNLTKERNCPKCGPGTFLGNHKDRVFCGACHYTEMKSAPKPVQ